MSQHLEHLEHISLQLRAFSNTLDTIQASFEIQKAEEEVISSYTTLRHSIDNIRAEVDIMISDIIDIWFNVSLYLPTTVSAYSTNNLKYRL